jgi:hypothetical protein
MRRFVQILTVFACFGVLSTLPAPVFAQTAPRAALRATRAAVPPKLDGVLDDEAWARAPLPLDTWISYNPMRGEPATQRTDVWVAYDEAAIYFAFKCFDTEPAKIRTTISRRDTAYSDDWIAISLDSSRAGQVAYHMFINPSGIQMDALNTGSNGEDNAPDWIWQSAGKVGADGYTVEVRLPLESIRFRGGSNVEMGVLFFRRISRSDMSWSWPAMAPGQWVFESNVPLIFDELHSRRLLQVIPSATLSSNQARTSGAPWGDSTSKGNLGASMKYGVTSAVTLEGTVNPDFSQVESDAFEVEVNNRFPVFFSEKRPFFMEGLGLFNLAGTGGDSNMRTAVHTRRIIDPSGGIKLTGSAGRQSFAFLSSADTSPPGSAQRMFTIGREVLNFGQGRYVGALVTDTEFRGEHNRVAGGDIAMRHGPHFQWNSALLYTVSAATDGTATRGAGAQGSYNYNTRRFTVAGQLEHYDKGFRMDTAFLNRVGITRGWQYEEVQFYPDPQRHGWLKRVAPFFWVQSATDRVQGGDELYVLPGIRFNFTRAGSLRLDYARGHETFAHRRFETGQLSASGGVQITRWLNLSGGTSKGPSTFYDTENPYQGDRRSTNFTIGLQPNARVSNRISYSFVTFDRRSTGENVYEVHIINTRNTYQFTPRLLARAIAQFDSSRRRILADFLASYELSPGTVAHAGYGSLFENPDAASYAATARAFFFKVSYLASF